MSIEWADLAEIEEPQLESPGSVCDDHGSVNEKLAFSVNELCIEGTAQEWIDFANAIIVIAQQKLADEAVLCSKCGGADLDETDIEVGDGLCGDCRPCACCTNDRSDMKEN